jgi:septum site-determining protein MinD
MREVIVIASGKGGVGKTVFTANMGAILAQKGFSVVLIDMNIGLRSLDICLGMENRIVYDISDVTSGTCRLKQALIKDRRFDKLYLMSAPQNKSKDNISPEQIEELCEELKESFDYIIIDAPAGLDKGFILAATPAVRAVIITVPEHAAIRDADMLDQVLEGMGISNKSVVVNKIMPELYGKSLIPEPLEISESLRASISGLIQYDLNIHVSANIGVPIVLAKGSYIEKNFSNIVERIIS